MKMSERGKECGRGRGQRKRKKGARSKSKRARERVRGCKENVANTQAKVLNKKKIIESGSHRWQLERHKHVCVCVCHVCMCVPCECVCVCTCIVRPNSECQVKSSFSHFPQFSEHNSFSRSLDAIMMFRSEFPIRYSNVCVCMCVPSTNW